MKKLTIPRIIGIIMLVLAVLTYQRHGLFRSAIITAAGLLLLLANREKAKQNWQKFVDSLRLKKVFVIIMLLDALFWAALAVFTLILANVLNAPYEQLKSVQFGQAAVTLGKVEVYNTIIESFFATTVISIIVFWILIVVAYSISRSWIWHALLEKKLKKGFYLNFIGLNLVWCTAWIALTLFFMSTLLYQTGAYVFIIMLLLYTHLTTMLHYSYTKSPGFTKSIKNAFGIGLGNLSKFAQPYCYLFIVYIILNQLQRFAQKETGLVVTLIVFLVYMAWYRTYLRKVI